MLEPFKKDNPCPRTEEKPQWDDRRGVIMIKSNPIPARWVTYKLENNKTKDILSLLWRFWTSCQASQPGDPTKGLGIPRESGLEGQGDLIIGLLQDWGKQTSLSGGTNKVSSAPRPKGKEQWPHRRLDQNYLQVLKSLLWRHGSAGAHHRMWGTGNSSLGRAPSPPWCMPWRLSLTLP